MTLFLGRFNGSCFSWGESLDLPRGLWDGVGLGSFASTPPCLLFLQSPGRPWTRPQESLGTWWCRASLGERTLCLARAGPLCVLAPLDPGGKLITWWQCRSSEGLGLFWAAPPPLCCRGSLHWGPFLPAPHDTSYPSFKASPAGPLEASPAPGQQVTVLCHSMGVARCRLPVLPSK